MEKERFDFVFQGEMIDSIEYNVSKATEHVDDARTDIKKAVDNKNKNNKVREIEFIHH